MPEGGAAVAPRPPRDESPRAAPAAGHPSGVLFAGAAFLPRKPDGGYLAVRRESQGGDHVVRVFTTAEDLAADLANLRRVTGARLLAARATAVVGFRAARARVLASSAQMLEQLSPSSMPLGQAATSARLELRAAPREVAAARWLLRQRALRDDDGAWDAAATAERLGTDWCPVWAAPGFLTQTSAFAPLARPWFFSRRALRRFVDAAVDAAARNRRQQRRHTRAAALAGRQMACELACLHFATLQARTRQPPAPPAAADDSDDSDDDGDAERDRMVAEASREMGGQVRSPGSAAASNAAAAEQRQLMLLSAAASAVMSTSAAMVHCWAAGKVEEVSDGIAVRFLRGRRLLATGSAADPARLEALSVASASEMLSRRPEDDPATRRRWMEQEADAMAFRTMMRLFFGGNAEKEDAAASQVGLEAEPRPTQVVYDVSAALEYLGGRWRDGPARDVQPLLVGHLEPAELEALAHNAEVCRRLPSAKRRKNGITGT